MRQPLGRRQPRLLRFADIAVRPVIPDSPFNQGPNKVWRLSGNSFFFWTFGPAEPARHLISAAHHVQLSLPKGDVTMRIKGNVKPRRGAGCLNGALVGQCQGQPAYRLAKALEGSQPTRGVFLIVDSAKWTRPWVMRRRTLKGLKAVTGWQC